MKNQLVTDSDLLPGEAVRTAMSLRKKFLKTLFHHLRHKAHPLYVLLSHLPADRFCIVRFYDYRIACDGWECRATPDRYTLREFYAAAGRFHPRDEFRLLLGERMLYFEQEATAEQLADYCNKLLYDLCEKRLRADDPLRLTRESIRGYGLTREDVRVVRERIEAYNTAAAAKIQAEYDALKMLDCITK